MEEPEMKKDPETKFEINPTQKLEPKKEEVSDEEEEWITPDNIGGGIFFGKEMIGAGQVKKAVEPSGQHLSVGILTSDFAMQNVILQIGIPLFSFEGMRVSTVKQFVDRCRACLE